jgi:TolB protein
MKNHIIKLFLAAALATFSIKAVAEYEIVRDLVPGQTKPILISLSGFSGEGAEVLRFDLYVQGFKFVSPTEAQYQITGSDAGNITGTLTDTVAKRSMFSRSYNGASVRRQAHAFADEIVGAILHLKPIGQSKIAFVKQSGGYGPGEIYAADFDGYGAQAITADKAIVARPAWVPGRMAVLYTSYSRGNPDIFSQDLSNGQRSVIAGYSGLNTSASVSPDGARIAMVLSKSGSPNIWVCDINGKNLKRLTTGLEDSSPCWSPDGKWICFATKTSERRRLAKIPAGGGAVQYLNTAGTPNPTEPDWSPDGKFIAFTSQMRDFNICVLPTDGSQGPTILATGRNPSWSPNSRTLVYNHGPDGRQTVSVLDVFTKQYKDCARATGSNSQPAWAK